MLSFVEDYKKEFLIMVYDQLNIYPFSLIVLYKPKNLTTEYHLTKVVLMEETNFQALKKEEAVPSSTAPSTLLDWWYYLLQFAEKYPQINFSSDIFSWPLFKKHYHTAVKAQGNRLIMVLDRLKTGNITYNTIEFIPNFLMRVLHADPLEGLKGSTMTLPPLVRFRKSYPNFIAYIINKQGEIKLLGYYTTPDIANRARVREQIRYVDDIIDKVAEINSPCIDDVLLIKLRRDLVRGLHDSLEKSYPITPKIAADIIKAEKEKKWRILHEPDPTPEEIAESQINLATERVITEVNGKLKSAAKHLRAPTTVVGEAIAYEYTQEFLEKRSRFNRVQIKKARQLKEDADADAEADDDVDVEAVEAAIKTKVATKPRMRSEPPTDISEIPSTGRNYRRP